MQWIEHNPTKSHSHEIIASSQIGGCLLLKSCWGAEISKQPVSSICAPWRSAERSVAENRRLASHALALTTNNGALGVAGWNGLKECQVCLVIGKCEGLGLWLYYWIEILWYPLHENSVFSNVNDKDRVNCTFAANESWPCMLVHQPPVF